MGNHCEHIEGGNVWNDVKRETEIVKSRMIQDLKIEVREEFGRILMYLLLVVIKG
jgi:hypothetical protein